MQRRGFLGAILAAGVAPAFVGARVLMPVRSIVLPPPKWNKWEGGSDDAFGIAMLAMARIDVIYGITSLPPPIGSTIKIARPKSYVTAALR